MTVESGGRPMTTGVENPQRATSHIRDSVESRPYQPHAAPSLMWQLDRQDDLTIGSLCSGYGGLEMGLQAVIGGRVAWHVEYDKHPSAVLAARFPRVPNYGDVTTTDWSQVEPVDWLTAGYPCQPFSHAGKRKGSADERHLWPFVAAAIGALRPGRVLLENVAGHVSLGLDAVLWDLAALGYDATWGVVRAADAGAPHGRARIFIVAADSTRGGWRRSEGQQCGLGVAERLAPAVADTDDRGPRDGRAGTDGRREPVDCMGAGQPVADAERCRCCEGRDAAQEGQPDATRSSRDGCAAADTQGVRRRARQGSSEGKAGHGEPGTLDGPRIRWGAYEPAIRRWEAVTGRPAPRPTEPGRTGERLSPQFVEWMQGLPDGWVTDILPRNPALKALGNGVVPQQAALAVRTLLSLEGEVAA